jgi:hypothetical protein
MDNTPPRNRLIALYSALAVVTLVALKPAFDAYFDRMQRRQTDLHLEGDGDMLALDEARGRWENTVGNPWVLGDDRRPIDRAMAELAERPREELRAIAPNTAGEMDLDPLRGWTRLPREVQAPPTPEAPLEEVVPPEGVPAPGEEAPAPIDEEPGQDAPREEAPRQLEPTRPQPQPEEAPQPPRGPRAQEGEEAPPRPRAPRAEGEEAPPRPRAPRAEGEEAPRARRPAPAPAEGQEP